MLLTYVWTHVDVGEPGVTVGVEKVWFVKFYDELIVEPTVRQQFNSSLERKGDGRLPGSRRAELQMKSFAFYPLHERQALGQLHASLS